MYTMQQGSVDEIGVSMNVLKRLFPCESIQINDAFRLVNYCHSVTSPREIRDGSFDWGSKQCARRALEMMMAEEAREQEDIGEVVCMSTNRKFQNFAFQRKPSMSYPVSRSCETLRGEWA